VTEEQDLLRSVYHIALRQGFNTNWEAFTRRLRLHLLARAGLPENADDNDVAIATCTAKTFRIIPSKGETP